MHEAKLKSLHIGKCLEDLKKKSENVALKNASIKALAKSAVKMYDEVDKYYKERDEEMCYIVGMRYLEIVKKLKDSKEYQDNKAFYVEKFKKEKVYHVLDITEEVAESLKIRYAAKLKEEEEEKLKALSQKEDEKAKNEISKTNKSSLVNGNSDSYDISISSKQLFDLLQEGKSKILLLDIRSRSDYEESQMKFPTCISVPQDIICAGITASKLESLLPDASRSLWSKRKDVDFIVMFDWSSTKKSLLPGTKLSLLKNILLRWDPEIVYERKPLILEGGFEDWLVTYPFYVTNPYVQPPKTKENGTDQEIIDKVQYPTLFDEKVLPQIDRASKPSSVYPSFESFDPPRSLSPVPIFEPTTAGRSEIKSAPSGGNENKFFPSGRSEIKSAPIVDRTSKANALKVMAEKKKEINEAEDKSMSILNDRMKLEGQWKDFRIQMEQEADRDRIEELQRREEELLYNLTEKEKEHRMMESELSQLRKTLEEHEREAERKGLLESGKITASTQVTPEKKIIVQKVEELSKERKRRLEEEKYKPERPPKSVDKGSVKGDIYITTLKTDEPSMSGSMKRSHSSPNIAQMLEAVDAPKHQVPHFDRSIKPLDKMKSSEVNVARQRDFSVVYGNVGPGLTGLRNLGNSCYMNSIIQCINNTMPLVTYFVEGIYRDEVNRQHRTRGKVAEEVGAVIRALWSGQYRSIACRDLKFVVGEYKSQFQGCEQQDSHEFLTILMDWLHEDLKRSVDKRIIEASSKPEDIEWEKFHASNNSQVSKLFFGQQRSTVSCCRCSESSVTYEPFSNLSLPIPTSGSKCTLQECVRLYLREERLTGWNCPKCKEARDATKKFDILRFPEILIIHLKRFQHDGWSRKKQVYVDFPLEGLDMGDFTPHTQQRHTIFTLHGVSNHYGSMEGGHYTAYCKNRPQGKWYKFDDHEVSEISPGDVRTSAAYILFYSSTKSEQYREL